MDSKRPTESAAQESADPGAEHGQAHAPPKPVLALRRETLPAIAEPALAPALALGKPKSKIRFRLLLFVGLLAIAAGAGWAYWRRFRVPPLPAGIVWSNGRIDAEEIDIDTKFAGRVAKLYVDEGDMVKAGQTIARMDTQDLEATLKKDQSLVRQNEHLVLEAQANVAQFEF